MFFFKQKTSNELRISDWSSDVCSSDLPPMPVIDRALYETVTTIEALDRWIEAARTAHVVAVDTETASLDSVTGDLVGVSLSTGPGKACYIPRGHGGTDMFAEKPDQIPMGSEEHTSELQSPMRISYAVFCLKKKNKNK